jgi:nitrogen regulatory protein PII
VNFVPKIKLEVAVDDAIAEQTVEAIRETAETGKIGDGKIFILNLEEVVRIRTGEAGAEAL